MTDIEEASDAFEDGINYRTARKWRDASLDASDKYEQEFSDILEDMNQASEETSDLDSWERFAKYAEIMCDKRGENGGG